MRASNEMIGKHWNYIYGFVAEEKVQKEGHPSCLVIAHWTAILQRFQNMSINTSNIVKEIAWNVKYTNDFFRQLENVNVIPLKSSLITSDIKSLNTKIKNN